jgi:hypothetical protein
MDTSSLRRTINSRSDIENICRFHSQELKVPLNEDPFAFLFALCGQESSFGANNIPRYEAAYAPNGIYHAKNKMLKEAYSEYGAPASCSYGPTQIMYIVARELGYPAEKHPLDLSDGKISIPYTVQLLNKNFYQGANNIDLMAACYNGGLGALKKQNDQVKDYIQKFRLIYLNYKFHTYGGGF